MMILDRTEPQMLSATLRSRYLTRLTGLVPMDVIDQIGLELFDYAISAPLLTGTTEDVYAELAGIVLKSHGIPA